MLVLAYTAPAPPLRDAHWALGADRCPDNPGGCCPKGRCGCHYSADQVLSLLPNILPQLGSRPAWLALGWIAKESGGWTDCADCCVPKLGGELGLFQLSRDERTMVGYTDEDRILNDADYSVASGLALIDNYGGRVTALGIDPSDDPAWGYLVKFMHAIGAGAATQIVQQYTAQTGAPPTSSTLDDFRSFAIGLGTVAGHSTSKWIGNADDVMASGVSLANQANLPVAQPAQAEGQAIQSSQTARKVLLGVAIIGLVGAAGWAGWYAYRNLYRPRRRAMALYGRK